MSDGNGKIVAAVGFVWEWLSKIDILELPFGF
jgi:hypothetical protein